jgi:hypothetical protein
MRTQTATNVWARLEAFANDRGLDCGDFMYMGEHGDVSSYKHSDTRRYLHLRGLEAEPMAWVDGEFFPITDAEAVAHVLA